MCVAQRRAGNVMSEGANTFSYVSGSVGDTHALGAALGRRSRANQCIALDGPLGAGKTQLVRGVAAGAQVADISLVSSPTYVLLNIYPGAPGGRTVYHLDAYRTSGAAEFAELGFDELFEQGGIVVVEWAEKIAALLPADHLHITLGHVGNALSDQRRLVLCATGPISAVLLNTVRRFLERTPARETQDKHMDNS